MSSDAAFTDHPINELNAAGAPDFVTADAGTILDMLKGFFETETGRTLSPSNAEMYLLETAAYMFSIRAAEDQQGFENCFVAWAQERFLEAHGTGRNTDRLQPRAATTNLQFETDAPALTRIRIPSGARVSDDAGQVQFLTLSDAFIEAGQTQIDVAAVASDVGSFANGFPIGSLTSIVDPVLGVAAVTNLTETGNGSEIEELGRYRARVALAFERIGDGLSKERYLSDVLGWNARCIAVEIIRPQPGYVSIYPLMDTGAANAEELASLLSVFDETSIHQGDYIQAFAPEAHVFSFPLDLTVSDPAAKDLAVAAVQGVLDVWGQSLGGYIAPSELIRVAKDVSGVIEADVPGLTFELVSRTKWRSGTISDVTSEVV
ncbi:baseplate J/gp47 family protein [Planktotalea sp.]|uniref:baseplate J/gp47 family protein n=1 Tax=Planktotalea sp. TaxID=2029877 RepID=UPI003D6B20F3